MLAKRLAKDAISRAFARDISSLRIERLKEVELVSFDVFDTLVRRSCGRPDAVFGIVERLYSEQSSGSIRFRERRMEADRAARGRSGRNTEVTLGEIYAELPFDPQVRDELMELEVACEIAVCEPKEDVVDVYDKVRASRAVALVSDMYLPRWAVTEILRSCGVAGYDGLYLSSDSRSMKRDGKLFRRVLEGHGLAPSDVFHVGDHPLEDWIVPRRLGMGAFLLRG